MNKIRTMESFVRIVKLGSLSRAADDLGTSRALISKHLQQLEAHLGVRLFNRTTRKMSLTEIGSKYYGFCNEVLARFEEEEGEISRLQKEPRGHLKIIAPTSFGNLHLSPIVAAFINMYPEISVSLVLTDTSFTPIDLVDKGYDLAICLRPMEDSTIVATKLGEIRWAVCASPGYLKKKGRPADPSKLAGHNCLIHRSIASDGIWRLESSERKFHVSVTGALVTNSVITLRDAALANVGVALLPMYCAGEDLRQGRLINIFPDCTVPNRPIFVLYPHSVHLQQKVRVFIDFLREHLRHHAWDRIPAPEAAAIPSRKKPTKRKFSSRRPRKTRQERAFRES